MSQLSPKELAAKLNVHPNTVYLWIHKRLIPVHRMSPHAPIRIDYNEFLKVWEKT